MRSASEVIEAIHAARYTGEKAGLHNTRALLAQLQLTTIVPAIHVAGTNGKGSVCAMLESVLRRASYRTGLYTSPFLQVYNERIRLDGVPMDDGLLAEQGNRVLDAAEKLGAQGIHPTSFELGTALALAVFEAAGTEVQVIEVGLGGRLDPTNVITPRLSVITAIGMDHMQILGDTVEAIAREKAGIIKLDVPVVAYPARESVAAVFRQAAAQCGAPLHQLTSSQVENALCEADGSTADYHLEQTWRQVRTALPGAHQVNNTLTVLGAVEALRRLGMKLEDETVYAGIEATHWPARLEWGDHVLLDGAHNPQGVAALQAYVDAHLSHRHRVLLTGVLEDHLNPDMLQGLCGLAEQVVTVTADSPRAMAAEELAALFRKAGRQAEAAAELSSGLCRARALAGADGVVLAAGSLYLAGALRTLLGLPWT